LSQSSEQPPVKGLAPRLHRENPVGNGVSPSEVLHGDHQLVRLDCFAAPPLSRATVRLAPSAHAVAIFPLSSLVVNCFSF
jgi:hypothetical protein